MDPKSKRVLTQQGSSVVQAMKWVGGAIFGDADDVLDDMAEKSEEDERRRGKRTVSRRPTRPVATPSRRRPPPPREPEIIDVEAFIEDEEDE